MFPDNKALVWRYQINKKYYICLYKNIAGKMNLKKYKSESKNWMPS